MFKHASHLLLLIMCSSAIKCKSYGAIYVEPSQTHAKWKIHLQEPSFISSACHNRGLISSPDAQVTTNAINGNKTFPLCRDQTPGRPVQAFSWAFHLEKEKVGKTKTKPKNAPQLCCFSWCVVDACKMKTRKEPQAFGWESFQNLQEICVGFGVLKPSGVNGKIQSHLSVLWMKPLIQKCVLREEAPPLHSYKAENSETPGST